MDIPHRSDTYYRTQSVVNVGDIMRRKGLSVEQVAKAAGLRPAQVRNCMSNDPYYPSVTEATVRKLCQGLGVEKHAITCGQEEAAILRQIEEEERQSERRRW